MSESSSSGSDGEETWIHWFCGLDGHEVFCEVDRSYIEDGFNLFGLRHWVPNINDCLDVILDRVPQNEASHELMEATCSLYGLIHARYVLTTAGLEAMYAKYTLQEFGNCPHFLCRGQSVVPLGVRDEPQMETVKLFCPKCQDVYVHPSHAAQRVDGAYFGTTFPHLFFMTYKGLVPDPPEKTFVPRVFGFRVHPRNLSGGGAQARGPGEQHEQRLQERRRLRRPHPPQTPPQQLSGAAAAAAAVAAAVGTSARQGETGGASAGAAAAVEVCAGSSPANGARAASGAAASGKGRGKGRAEGGSVVVRIKEEEEENWTKGRGPTGGAGKTGAGAGTEDVNGKVDGSDSGPRDGGASLEARSAENGRQASPPRSSPTMEARAGPAGGQGAPGVTRNGGGNTRDARDQELTSNGIRGNGKGKEAERGDDNGGGSDRARRGGGRAESVASSTGANGDASGATAAVAREREGAGGASRSGGTPERGTKRLSEVELEAAAVALAGGSGAGERGAGGRPRGKMPRGRSHSSQTSSAAPGASSLASAAPAAVAVEGRGAGSSGRRRGRSPM